MSEAIKNSPYLTGAWKQGLKEGKRVGAVEELEKMKAFVMEIVTDCQDLDCMIGNQEFEEYYKKRLSQLGDKEKGEGK